MFSISINIFNRKEILLTRDLNILNNYTDNLKKNNIDYIITTNSITNSGRSHGVIGINQNYSYEYRLFVKWSDSKKLRGIKL